jgi:hypothetical protein
MISQYESLTGELDLETMMRSREYFREYSDEPSREFLYFGGWNHERKERNGYGVYVNKSIILEGTWKCGYILRGAELKSQSIYKGQFKNNKRSGEGECKWLNGESYIGQWDNGLRHGHGRWSSKDGRETYLGEWSHGKVTGQGEYFKKNWSVYRGTFMNFVKTGEGV